ncbi:maleylpyruvate isomerase family mycothiol-dependent enzyme [Actinoplanes sp. NBC_00393]|uniref:maleylpyruvate isomerase family mycothiol-dependent enzyme n=1 Tax=Actinoplanes sp. NBC_00393 TaxID=2975953 RepID=UPI002E1FF02E
MLTDHLRWAAQGTRTFLGAMATLPDERLDQPTALPGWTGKHLLAHVAANAEALINLTTWARTGVETPMYTSPEQRDADIAAGSRRPAGELRAWVTESAAALEVAMTGLQPVDWEQKVRTAQGRTVPASEVPWMRAREVMIHAVDLGAGVRFTDLPSGFLAALVDDIVAKRSAAGDGPAVTLSATDHYGSWTVTGAGEPAPVIGTLAGIAAYLAGRATDGVRHAPALPRWL